MMNRVRNSLANFCILLSSLAATSSAHAFSIYFDFGSFSATPSSAFGGAPGVPGHWNQVASNIIPSGVVDSHGNSTSVKVAISGAFIGGFDNDNLPAGNTANPMVEDQFHTTDLNTPWLLTISGLPNGVYDVYLYDPHHPAVGTGSGAVNGVPFQNINGNFASGTFLEDSNYLVRKNIAVTAGTLSLEALPSGDPVFIFPYPPVQELAGLAGLQIIDTSLVPLPASIVLFPAAAALLLGRRRKSSPMSSLS